MMRSQKGLLGRKTAKPGLDFLRLTGTLVNDFRNILLMAGARTIREVGVNHWTQGMGIPNGESANQGEVWRLTALYVQARLLDMAFMCRRTTAATLANNTCKT